MIIKSARQIIVSQPIIKGYVKLALAGKMVKLTQEIEKLCFNYYKAGFKDNLLEKKVKKNKK